MAEGRRYKIHAVLGQGGFGTVYMAELLGEGGFTRKVALKVLNPDMAGIDDVANRLRDEARLLGILRHRAIVNVDGLVMLNDRWTVVMEYIEGVDLQRLVRGQGPVPLGCALEIISEVASALDVAYITPGPDGKPLNLLHRDIKPPNILLTKAGEAKVLDFGIARADFTNREAKTKSVLYGSIGYMAPERLEFVEVPGGDVFALGCVLFEMLDGNPLGKGSINPEKHKAHIDSSIARLLDKLGRVPPDFGPMLASMLAYEPDDRPTAREVERGCRALRGQFGEPWLRDWAEKVVPPLLAEPGVRKTDELSGSIVTEGTPMSSPNTGPLPPPPNTGVMPPVGPNSGPLTPPQAAGWPSGPFQPGVGYAEPPPSGQQFAPPHSGPLVGSQAPTPMTFRIERPPPRRGWGGVIALFGCLFVLIVGGGGLIGVLGLGTAGGLLAALALVPSGPSYVPPPTYPTTSGFPGSDGGTITYTPETEPDVDPTPTTTGDGGYYGALGIVAEITDPWKSMNLPIGSGVIGYSDATSIIISEASGSTKDMADRYTKALINAGWSKQYDYNMEGMVTKTFTKNGKTLTLSVMTYEGQLMLSASVY